MVGRAPAIQIQLTRKASRKVFAIWAGRSVEALDCALFFAVAIDGATKAATMSGSSDECRGEEAFPTPPLPLMMRLICLFAEGCVDQSMRRSAMREPRMRGRRAGGLITGVDVGDSKVVENAMIAGPATGSPTIHVLNVTASAIESLTMSWWCSSYWRPR